MINTYFFLNQNNLTESLLPFLTGEELANISRVNKTSEKAAKVDLLWEKLCLNSIYDFYCRQPTWRQHYILKYNWSHGMYRETSKVLDMYVTDFHSPLYGTAYGANPTQDGIKIHILENGREIFLKAPGFMNRTRFLNKIIFSGGYAFIKTDSEIQIYQLKNGELVRAIPVTNPDWNYGAVTSFNDTIASIDLGGVVRVWNITSGELLWEESFLNQPQIQRFTSDFKFINKTTIRWAWNSRSPLDQSVIFGYWDLDVEKKSINEGGPLNQPNDDQHSLLKNKYAEKRKNILEESLKSGSPIRTPPPHFSSQYRDIETKYSLIQDNRYIFSEWFQLSASYTTFSSFKNIGYGFSDIRILDKNNSVLFLKRFENLKVTNIMFTVDKMFIAAQEKMSPLSQKTTIITCDFNPKNKPERHPEHISESNLTPTFLDKIKPPIAPLVKTLLQRIVDFAIKMFMFITYPFRKAGELSLRLLKGTVRIIHSAFARRI